MARPGLGLLKALGAIIGVVPAELTADIVDNTGRWDGVMTELATAVGRIRVSLLSSNEETRAIGLRALMKPGTLITFRRDIKSQILPLIKLLSPPQQTEFFLIDHFLEDFVTTAAEAKDVFAQILLLPSSNRQQVLAASETVEALTGRGQIPLALIEAARRPSAHEFGLPAQMSAPANIPS